MRLVPISRAAGLTLASIAKSQHAALFIGDLAAADQYTHRHSINVAEVDPSRPDEPLVRVGGEELRSTSPAPPRRTVSNRA